MYISQQLDKFNIFAYIVIPKRSFSSLSLVKLKRQVEDHLQKKCYNCHHPHGCSGGRCGNSGTINSGQGSNSGNVDISHSSGNDQSISFGK